MLDALRIVEKGVASVPVIGNLLPGLIGASVVILEIKQVSINLDCQDALKYCWVSFVEGYR